MENGENCFHSGDEDKRSTDVSGNVLSLAELSKTCGTCRETKFPFERRTISGNDEGGNMMENEFFVGWGTLALINAGLAQGKNRSGFNWFLLSLVFGPIATLLIVIWEKLPESKHE
jgi:hypothetical protein